MRGSKGLRTLRRLDGHGTGHVGDAEQLAGADQGVGQEGGADLRAVDERQPFLGLELVRLEVDAAEGGASAHRPRPATGVRVGVGAGPRDEGMALADDDEGEVGQRREVAAGADAALLRDGRERRRGCTSR